MNENTAIKQEEKVTFPVSVIEINRYDIEIALYTFDEEVQEILTNMPWNDDILKKIVTKLRNNLVSDYYELLPRAIKEVLKEEVEEAREKRTFLSGLRNFLKKRDEVK